MKLQKIIIFIFSITLCSCFQAVDPDPNVTIKIDKEAILEIDSLELISNYEYNLARKEKVTVNDNKYIFENWDNELVIKLKLKKGTEIRSGILNLSETDKILISENNGTYSFKPQEISKTILVLKFLLSAFIIAFLTKVLTGCIIMKPDSMKSFVLRYGIYSIFFQIIFSLLLYARGQNESIIFYLGTTLLIFSDFILLYILGQKKDKIRAISTVIVGNLLLGTAGTYLYSVLINTFW